MLCSRCGWDRPASLVQVFYWNFWYRWRRDWCWTCVDCLNRFYQGIDWDGFAGD